MINADDVVALDQVVVPTIRYCTLYERAPETAVHVRLTELVEADKVVAPVGIPH